MCEHIYKNMGVPVCPLCNRDTHEIDWKRQNQINKEWKAANPEAAYGGWWSI